MHDTGKIGIPDAILKKPAKLDAAEWAIMQTHSAIGHEILSMSDAPIFQLAADIAHAHHEKWDGISYPQGLAKEAIPEGARIVAIAVVEVTRYAQEGLQCRRSTTVTVIY